MRRQTITAIALASLASLGLILVGALILMGSKQEPVEGKLYIRSDGTVSPPTTTIHHDGDTYTFTTNIQEAIIVQRNAIIIDGNGYTLNGNGTDGIYLHKVQNVTIQNTRITGFQRGIHLLSSANCTLNNNTITDCVYGTIIADSPRNILVNNTVANNAWDGIFMTDSDGSRLYSNLVANHSKWGIYLGFSAGSILRKNTMEGNARNFAVTVEFDHDIDPSNTIDGNPIYYWRDHRHQRVPPDAAYVALINCVNVTAKNLDLHNNGQGILLVNSRNCLLANLTLTNNGYYGAQLINSDDNTVANNTIMGNAHGGILTSQSTGNHFINNIIEANHLGIHLQDAAGNFIYHNNFVNNTHQALSEDSTNVWDDGYPSGGNYWSDYNESDVYCGPEQDMTGSDGIGDTNYAIDPDNTDRYPLTNPWMSPL